MKISAGYVVLVLGFLSLLGASEPAHAYTWAKNPTSGKCVYWPQRQVSVHLNQACDAQLDFQACEDAVKKGLLVWNDPSCADFQFVYAGTTSDSDVGYDTDNPQANTNLIVWRENHWPYTQSAIAITTTVHEISTGKIVDADLELNAIDYTYSVDGMTGVQTDIQNTIAHEAGHMLGLDHSDVAASTMYARAVEGDTQKRDLHQDDIDGLCRIYPSGEKTIQCDSTVDPDPPDPMERVGCATTTAGPPWGLMPVLVLMLLYRPSRRSTAQSRSL